MNSEKMFHNRLFVLTNKGIHIMKNLPAGQGSRKCPSCPNSAFCPAGPSKEEFIKFEQIQTVINFPQLPQKMVIKYFTPWREKRKKNEEEKNKEEGDEGEDDGIGGERRHM